MGDKMIHATIREPHGPEGNRGAKLTLSSFLSVTLSNVEWVRIILSFENLRTPRKIEGRRIEG